MEEFDFMSDKNKKAGRKEEVKKTKKSQTATSGNPGEITPEIKAAAIKLAESPEGLDIAKFQKKYKLHVVDVDEILKG